MTDNLAVPSSAYDSYCITAPSDSRLPGGGGNQICGLYDVESEYFGQVDTLVTQASNYGKMTQVYNGLDLTLSGRLAGGGQFSGGLSMGRTVTDNCLLNGNFSVNNPPPTGVGNVFLNACGARRVGHPAEFEFRHVAPPWSSGTQVKFPPYPLPWISKRAASSRTAQASPSRPAW